MAHVIPAARAQLDARRLEGDVEYTETDEEEKGVNLAQLVADRQIALSAQPYHSFSSSHASTPA
jgi:hypothetical protein